MLERYEAEKKLQSQSCIFGNNDSSSEEEDEEGNSGVVEYTGVDASQAATTNIVTKQCGSATVEIADLALNSVNFIGHNTVCS